MSLKNLQEKYERNNQEKENVHFNELQERIRADAQNQERMNQEMEDLRKKLDQTIHQLKNALEANRSKYETRIDYLTGIVEEQEKVILVQESNNEALKE